MQLHKENVKIVCDVTGCGKIAKYFIKKDNNTSISDSLKLCPSCSKSLVKILNSAMKEKENQSE